MGPGACRALRITVLVYTVFAQVADERRAVTYKMQPGGCLAKNEGAHGVHRNTVCGNLKFSVRILTNLGGVVRIH